MHAACGGTLEGQRPVWQTRPIDRPKARVIRIDRLKRIAGVPDRRKRVRWFTVNRKAPRRAARLCNGKDLTRWLRDHFRLKPTVLVATPRVQLPWQISGDGAERDDLHMLQFAVTDRATNRGPPSCHSLNTPSA